MAQIEFTTARGAKIQVGDESKLSVNGGAVERFEIDDDAALGLILRVVRRNVVAKTVQEIKIPVPAEAASAINALRPSLEPHVVNPWTL